MVVGMEAAGLALAVLPLLVYQVGAYALGIERIKILRRYRREFKGYSIGLETQHKILLKTRWSKPWRVLSMTMMKYQNLSTTHKAKHGQTPLCTIVFAEN